MTPGFRLSADRGRGLLLIELSGFFDPSDVSRFAAEKRAAHRELGCAPNRHVTLVDITACKIQPQDVVSNFSALIAEPRYKARRLAFVTGSSLAKMQVRRLTDGIDDARCFADRSSAEAWLLAD